MTNQRTAYLSFVTRHCRLRTAPWFGPLLAIALAACAGPVPTGEPNGTVGQAAATPKRLTAAILTDLYSFGPRGGAVPGKDNVLGLLHAGLANADETMMSRARLAEDVPSVANGLWKLLPNGRMETTWKLREGARWHDGEPFTTEDLPGNIELMLGRGISLDQALQVRDQWRDGRVEIALTNWIVIYPQYLYTVPQVVRDLRFRRALLYATNRQEMVDTLQSGYSQVAHSVMNPGQPQYQDFEAQIPHYDYDLRSANQLMDELGYRRGADGSFRDAQGQVFGFEFRTVPTDINTKSLLATTNYWKQWGIDVNPVIIPAEQQRLLEYRAKFPAFELLRNPNEFFTFQQIHSSMQRAAANNWSGGYSGYSSSEYDALYERYASTIPTEERRQAIGQIINYIADQVVVMGLFYDTLPVMIGSRIANLQATRQKARTRCSAPICGTCGNDKC